MIKKKGKKIKETKMNANTDLETRLLRLENATSIGEALIYKTKKLEEQVKALEMMFEAMLKMARPVAQPKGYRSGEWHRRSGNIYQDIALPGSPNAKEADTTPTSAREAADNPAGDLPPSK